MSKSVEVTVEPDNNYPQQNQPDHDEEGVDVPWDSINQETLRNLISEFVTREWPDTEYSLETKIDQVHKQLRTGQAKIVFDLLSKTCNIIPTR